MRGFVGVVAGLLLLHSAVAAQQKPEATSLLGKPLVPVFDRAVGGEQQLGQGEKRELPVEMIEAALQLRFAQNDKTMGPRDKVYERYVV